MQIMQTFVQENDFPWFCNCNSGGINDCSFFYFFMQTFACGLKKGLFFGAFVWFVINNFLMQTFVLVFNYSRLEFFTPVPGADKEKTT